MNLVQASLYCRLYCPPMTILILFNAIDFIEHHYLVSYVRVKLNHFDVACELQGPLAATVEAATSLSFCAFCLGKCNFQRCIFLHCAGVVFLATECTTYALNNDLS